MFSSNTTGYPVPNLSYITSATSTTGTNVYSFTNTSIGGPGRIIVGMASENAGFTSNQITSVRFGGVNADYLTSTSGLSYSGGVLSCGIASLNITSGTTSTIEVTWPNNQLRMAIMVWRLLNNQYQTPIFIGSAATGNIASGTLVSVTHSSITNYPTAVGVAVCGHGAGGTTMTFSTLPSEFNITERADAQVGTGDTRFGGAQFTVPYTTPNTSAAVRVAPNANISQGIVLISSVWL